MEKEKLFGLMEGNIKVHGKMVDRMEKDYIIAQKKGFGKKEFGIMEKE
jgi:hypothetical protein